MAGASDRVFVTLGISYVAQVWFYRVAVWVVPVVVLVVTRRACNALREAERLRADREQAELEGRAGAAPTS